MKNKTLMSKIKKDYVKTSSKMGDLDLSSNAFKLYWYFCKLPENSNPGVGAAMKFLKVSRKTAYNAINELENRNMIRMIVAPDTNRRAIYELTPPAVWK